MTAYCATNMLDGRDHSIDRKQRKRKWSQVDEADGDTKHPIDGLRRKRKWNQVETEFDGQRHSEVEGSHSTATQKSKNEILSELKLLRKEIKPAKKKKKTNKSDRSND